MKQGAVCVVCNKKIDPATDRPVYDRRKWYCGDDCWKGYINKIFQQLPE